MSDLSTYLIQIRGRVEADEINQMAPLHMNVIRSDTDATLLAARTDQAGLVGLMRHLHSQGFVLLSMCCEPYVQEGT